MTRTIVGHVSPDWDCIAALWLLQRFGGFEDATIALVNTGAPDPTVLAEAAAVVDTGRVYDPSNWRFDHHQLPGAEANNTCAAFQVFQHIAPDERLDFLAPLNALILNGDTGGRHYGAEWSRLTGIHALLSAWKARKVPDDLLIQRGYDVLDDLAEHLLAAREARQSLDDHTVYRSADGLLIALDGAPQGATFAAFEAGARLVVWHNPQADTIGVGINRAPESGIDCGKVVAAAIQATDQHGVVDELVTWFCHNSGFFAGRGTAKAPDAAPLRASFVSIAAALDAAWVR
jgi:hypothetical protein